MESTPQIARLVRRARWLIKLRWIAIVGVVVATLFAHTIMGVAVQDVPLYCIAAALVLHNVIALSLLTGIVRSGRGNVAARIKKVINYQISIDLVTLTILLHFSGGIESPIVIYFVFHMIIASILLSVWESYLQATLAVALIALLAALEYKGVIPHYCLKGFLACNMQVGGAFYVAGTVFILSTTLYLVVYMTSSISTQLRKQEESCRQAYLQLQRKDRIKDEYVLRMTHDIKGHCAAIQSCLAVLAKNLAGPLNEQQADFVHRAHDRTRKLTTFVRALLRLTQIRLTAKLEMQTFSLRQTLSTAVEAVRSKAEDKAVSLNVDIEPSVDEAFGDHFSIEETITNLLLNAIKYTPVEGSIRVDAKDNGDAILVEIADTGIGIPASEVDKVFDEFFRASNARKVERDGTGLGLSMAKQTILRHGGDIWVQSREGAGTTISFTLPKQPLEETQQQDQAVDQTACPS
jgi:signal transduction histidine kinase